jgi:hypothetical protein
MPQIMVRVSPGECLCVGPVGPSGIYTWICDRHRLGIIVVDAPVTSGGAVLAGPFGLGHGGAGGDGEQPRLVPPFNVPRFRATSGTAVLSVVSAVAVMEGLPAITDDTPLDVRDGRIATLKGVDVRRVDGAPKDRAVDVHELPPFEGSVVLDGYVTVDPQPGGVDGRVLDLVARAASAAELVERVRAVPRPGRPSQKYGLEPTAAERIIAARDRLGDLSSLDALASAAKLDQETVENLRFTFQTMHGCGADLDEMLPPARPAVVGVSPASPAPLEYAVIEGSGFGDSGSELEVWFGQHRARVLKRMPTQLHVEMPEEVRDQVDLVVERDGRPSAPFPLRLRPAARLQTIPGQADGVIEVLGTGLPALVEVSLASLVLGLSPVVLQTAVIGGRNVAALPLGGLAAVGGTATLSVVGVNAPLVGATAAVGAALVPVLASLTIVQLVGRNERDPATNRERTVYYFFRNGRWWRVRDPERRHPEDREGIDVREDVADPNFEAAPAATAAALDSQFFPTGWEEAWREFDATNRVQLQIMFAMAMQMGGLDENDAQLLYDVRRMLAEGRTVQEVLEAKQDQVISFLIGVGIGVVATGAGRVGARLLTRIFRGSRSSLLRRVTRRTEANDTLTLEVDPRHLPRNARGTRMDATGRVDRATGELRVDSSTANAENLTGERGFLTEVSRAWFDDFRDFARQRGLRQVRYVQVASTPRGAAMLERLGFQRRPGCTRPDGTGIWERVEAVTPN